MKKITAIALVIATLCLFSACAKGAGNDTTEADTTIPVTSPEGFEDVTAPAEDGDKKDDTTKAEETTVDAEKFVNSSEEAVEAARAWLGESDPETGYKYAYSYDGSMVENDIAYFRVRVSWYIEDQERYSLCGYLLVSPYGDVSKFGW